MPLTALKHQSEMELYGPLIKNCLMNLPINVAETRVTTAASGVSKNNNIK